MIALLVACTGGPSFPPDLEPYPNPFGPGDPLWAPQPHRDRPLEVAWDGERAWVSLQGTADAPGHEVVAVDPAAGEVLGRVEVGSSPTGLAVHPDGDLLVVCNRYSAYLSVVDTAQMREVQRIPTDPYAIEGVFSPDGAALYVTNRWRDAVLPYAVARRPDGLELEAGPPLPVGANPRDIAISPDGRTLAVAALTGLTVSLVDTASWTERARVSLGAPPNGLAFVDGWLVVPTLSASTHHLPDAGPDGDGDGLPGDGTPNVNFQDLQNEIAVIDPASGEIVHRYTSDTICCFDYRDVDPEDTGRRGDLLPPRDTWIVGGSLPEQVAAWSEDEGDAAVWVTYSGSNEIQRFALDPDTGALAPGPVLQAGGHNPHGIARAGDRLLVVHRLGETLGVRDLEGALLATVEVGDRSGGDFPATDAEIGTLFNAVTAPFTVDGDQTCVHCHREGGNIDKAFSMPLTLRGGLGLRMVMAYRGAADTRPWFFESAMDEANFKPVINEFARIENFCCSDYTLFPDGAPPDCDENPPPECATASNPGSLDGFDASRDTPFLHARPTDAPSRDRFFLEAARELIGRDTSFGDGLYYEDPVTGTRTPIALDFDGMTRALGLFLLQEPRLLPNPNPATSLTERGEALFHDPQVGCAVCHPLPAGALSTDVNPDGLPIRMAPVVTPFREEGTGVNLDLYSGGFVDTFPVAEMEACEDVCDPAACAEDPSVCDDRRDVFLGVPPLRGLWDRAPSMLHHGLAKGLIEVLATPGHPALAPGETGFNETDGIPNTHGSTSHLSPEDLEALAAFLMTL